MAGEPQGLMHFPGINQIVGGSFTLTHGRSPSVATLSIAPQSGWPAEGGTLTISFGGTTVQFPNCKVDSASFSRNGGGQVVSLQILDRRWKWAWGWISGSYNERDSEGNVKQGTEKTPQELAKLLLDAMGESGYSVSQLPNDTRPVVEWDFDLPSEALAQLCDDLGCRIVLGLDDKVRLLPAGQGQSLDTSYILDQGATVNPPEMPDKLAVVCSHVRYQVELELEAVAKQGTEGERDKYVLIDDVGYAPAAGWDLNEVPYWQSVDDERRPEAQENILRAFRVKVPFNLPAMGGMAPAVIKSLDQFELLPERVEVLFEGQANEFVRSANPAVRGKYFPNKDGYGNNIDALKPEFDVAAFVDRDFRIDAAAKVVLFDEPIYANGQGGSGNQAMVTVVRPTLRLQVAITVRNEDTRAPIRYVREQNTGSNFDTPTQYLSHEEIIVAVITKYDNAWGVAGSADNRLSANAEADYYIAAALAEYQTDNPQSVSYPGIVAIEPDGAIGQITWSVGTGGATTSANRNAEQSRRTLPYKEKRRIQMQQAEIKRLARNARDPLLNGQNPVRFKA